MALQELSFWTYCRIPFTRACLLSLPCWASVFYNGDFVSTFDISSSWRVPLFFTDFSTCTLMLCQPPLYADDICLLRTFEDLNTTINADIAQRIFKRWRLAPKRCRALSTCTML